MQSAELIEALSKTIMEFKWCQIDPATASKQELEAEIVRLNDLMYKYINMEQGVKIFINSVYGATGSPWFIFFNPDVAEAVTLQGQDLIKYSEKIINRYFLEFWHKDKKLHQLLNLNRVEKIDLPVVIYIDTDSVAADTKIRTDQGEMTIEDLYNLSRKFFEVEMTLTGKEIANSSIKVLNEKNGKILFSPVKKVIRHRVSKKKWKLKTSSGKEVIVTGDHSLIVLREGKKVEIKPSDVKKGEKVICVNINSSKQ
jgi:DNA polymerase elongation subunit (family B)